LRRHQEKRKDCSGISDTGFIKQNSLLEKMMMIIILIYLLLAEGKCNVGSKTET
jgi:hypothetical protein